MKRNKRLSKKPERAETSTATAERSRSREEHDLTHYIDDRVELMRQTFSVLSRKELKAMVPECARKLSNDELEELCLGELLGISSKRLVAILDGAAPPSDTDTSSDSDDSKVEEPVIEETILLDSAMSEAGSSKSGEESHKKHKKKKRRHRKKKNRQDSDTSVSFQSTAEASGSCRSNPGPSAGTVESRATKASHTVLELLELQARARAIRAQLQSNQSKKKPETITTPATEASVLTDDDDDDVKIKEEAAEIVEIISSDDEKPNIEELKEAAKEPEPAPPPAPPPKPTKKRKKSKKDKSLKLLETVAEKADENTFETAHVISIVETETEIRKNAKTPIAATEVNEATTPSSVPPLQTTKNQKKTMKSKSARQLKTITEKADEDNVETEPVLPEVAEADTAIAISAKSQKVVTQNDYIIDLDSTSDCDATEVSSENNTPCTSRFKNANDLTITVPQNDNTVSRKVEMDKDKVIISVLNIKQIKSNKMKVVTEKLQNKIGSAVTKVKKNKVNSIDSKVANEKSNELVDKSTGEEVDKSKDNVETKIISNEIPERIKNKGKHLASETAAVKKTRRPLGETTQPKAKAINADEITLQLSDSEYSDLLQSLDRRSLDKAPTSDEDSSSRENSSSEDTDSETASDGSNKITKGNISIEKVPKSKGIAVSDNKVNEEDEIILNKKQENKKGIDSTYQTTTIENTGMEKTLPNGRKIKFGNAIAMELPVNKKADFIKDASYLDKILRSSLEDTYSGINNDDSNKTSKRMESIEKSSRNITVGCIELLNNTMENTELHTETPKITGAEQDCIDDIAVVTNDITILNRPGTPVLVAYIAHKEHVTSPLSKQENLVQADDENYNKSYVQNVDIVSEKALFDNNLSNAAEKDRSEGEISDHSSSEIEAIAVQTEIVSISDEEVDLNTGHKKKNKKVKKNKKEKVPKKAKNKLDCRTHIDQKIGAVTLLNPVTENKVTEKISKQKSETAAEASNMSVTVIDEDDKILLLKEEDSKETHDCLVSIDSDDVYETLELSDDSSCYEVEGISVLSKEPTSEEIEALSAKIDEIDKVDVITGGKIDKDVENKETDPIEDCLVDVENVSWKDRYLGSKKVKQVLTTSNILNAMRKKNKELKKKLLESKINKPAPEMEKTKVAKEPEIPFEEGSIDQYNTLQGSTLNTAHVEEMKSQGDSIDEVINAENDDEKRQEDVATPKENLTMAMKKDAKQLLKMYKKLLKYNDMYKPKDPIKKKSKKKKRKKKEAASATENSSDN